VARELSRGWTGRKAHPGQSLRLANRAGGGAPHAVEGGVAVAADGIHIRRALPHGHAAAVLGTIRAIGLDRLLGKPSYNRFTPLAIALIASRLVSPASKLATARELAAATAASSLGRLPGLGEVDEVELYRALDWLGARQSAIETGLAHRHLTAGALVLYDVS